MSEVQTIHLPIGMGSVKHIEDLPNDALVEIFSYMSIKDLVLSMQHVSCRWHGVAQDSHLWRKLQYDTFEDKDGEIVSILKQTPKLQTLFLDYRAVSSSVLSAFMENCSELRKLKLYRFQKVSKQLMSSLVLNCLKLEYLTIPGKIVSMIDGAQMIGQLQKLKTLKILDRNDSRHSVLLGPISDGCPLLQHLDIQHKSLKTADLKYFMQLKQHQLLSIKVNVKTYEDICAIPHLTVCKTLKKVLIHGLCGFEAVEVFQALGGMKNVTALTFSKVRIMHLDNVVSLFSNKGMCHLVELKFKTFPACRDELSLSICNNCPLLKVLCFEDCYNMTDRSLENLHKLTELEHLNLCGCNKITDSGTEFVFECINLKYLDLSDCTQLTEQCMEQLIFLNLLETLILDGCNIEGLPLNLIPTFLKKLKLLSVVECRSVNVEGLNQLRAEMPHLILYTV